MEVYISVSLKGLGMHGSSHMDRLNLQLLESHVALSSFPYVFKSYVTFQGAENLTSKNLLSNNIHKANTMITETLRVSFAPISIPKNTKGHFQKHNNLFYFL